MESVGSNQGRYEIVRPLAEGGFGQVYLARIRGEAGFHRTVAIKRIRPELVSGPEFISDFIKEARIGGYLQHHNVVQVLGFERLAGHYALIMDFVDGVGLERVIQREKAVDEPLPVAVVAEIIAQAADGLNYVHTLRSPEGEELELVHRDLKPSNLLISRAGLVKISDFGIARAAVQLGQQRTQAGIIKGTVAYFSPEQARGEPMDRRSDLYSLGSILYEILAQEALFPDREPFAVLGKVGRNDIEGRLDALPEHAHPFLPILRQILTSAPEDRIESAAAMATALRSLQIDHAKAGESLANHAGVWCDWASERSRADDLQEDTLVLQAGREDPWLISMQSGANLQEGDYSAHPTQRGELASTAEAPTSQVDRNKTQTLRALADPLPDAETAQTEHLNTGGAPSEHTLKLPEAAQTGSHEFARAPGANSKLMIAAAALLVFIIGGSYVIFTRDTGAGGSSSQGGEVVQPPVQPPVQAELAKPPVQDPKAAPTPPVAVAAKPEVQPQPKATPKPAPKATPKPAPKATPKPAPKATPKPAPKAPVVAPAPVATPKPAPPPVKVATADPGTVTISSLPAAQVFLDGKSLGETPIRKHSLSAGSHSLRLSRPDLGYAKEVSLKVGAGANLRVLCHEGGCDVTETK